MYCKYIYTFYIIHFVMFIFDMYMYIHMLCTITILYMHPIPNVWSQHLGIALHANLKDSKNLSCPHTYLTFDSRKMSPYGKLFLKHNKI